MGNLESRLARLEGADPPPVVRHDGESAEDFGYRMAAAINSLPDDTPQEAVSAAIRSWLEAMTTAELVDFRDALVARQAEAWGEAGSPASGQRWVVR